MIFRQRAFKRLALVDHGLGDCVDPIPGGQLGKLGGLDAVGRNVLVFNCKLVGQADRPRTMGSGGRDKDLQMDGLVQMSKFFFALRAQAGVAR